MWRLENRIGCQWEAIAKCTQLGKDRQFFVVKVKRWPDNNKNTNTTGDFKPNLDYRCMRIGEKVELFEENCTTYHPVASVTMDQNLFTKSCKYTFQCWWGPDKDWYEIDGEKNPQKRNDPNTGIIYLFMSDFVNAEHDIVINEVFIDRRCWWLCDSNVIQFIWSYRTCN